MNKKKVINDFLPEFKIDEMKQKRSTRTTFNISEEAHNALNWLSKYYKITMKEVFDSACDKDGFVGMAINIVKRESDDKTKNGDDLISFLLAENLSKIRKTYVTSNSVHST